MISSIRTRRWTTALMVIVISMLGTAAAAQEIGTTTAVTVLTTGQPPGAAVRRLKIGTNVVANERVVTSQSGRAQMIFHDRSSLIVAPNSNLVLDEYVYDPDTKVGKVVFSTTKGFFRFVGGVISKKNKVEFRTPLATIALRGGIADVSISPKSVVAIKHFGVDVVVTLRLPDGAVRHTRVLRNGFKATVTEQGGSVQIEKVTQAEIDGNLAKLEGKATDKPAESEQPIADAGSSREPADLAPVEPATQAAEAAQKSVFEEKVPESDIVEEAQDNVSAAPEPEPDPEPEPEPVAPEPEPEPEPQPPPGIGVPQVTFYGQYQRNPVQNFEGTTGADRFIELIPAHNVRYGDGQIDDGRFTASLNGPEIRLPVPNYGDFTFDSTGTSSPFGPVSGTGFFSPDQDFFFYTLRESEHAGNLATIFGGIPITSDLFPASGFATHRHQTVHPIPDVAGGDVLGLLREYTLFTSYGARDTDLAPGVLGGAAVVFDGSGTAQRSAMLGTSAGYWITRLVEGGPREGPIEMLGGTRASTRRSSTSHPAWALFNFYSVHDENKNSLFGANAPDFFVTSTQDSNVSGIRVPGMTGYYQTFGGAADDGGRFHTNGFAQPATSPTGLGSPRTTRTLFGYTGGIVEIGDTQGVFDRAVVLNSDLDVHGHTTIPDTSPSGQTGLWIATDAGSNWLFVEISLLDIEDPDGIENSFLRFGTPPNTRASRSTFIDDRRFIARDLSPVASDAIGNGFVGIDNEPIVNLRGSFATSELLGNVLPDGVTPCECEYLRWGYWSVRALVDRTTSDDPNDMAAVHIASWVAGEIPDAVDIPTTGTASYGGHIVGNVNNGASYYVSAGRFTQQYNFATDTGTFSVTNFDGADYSGAVSATNLRNDFQGANIQGSSSRAMNLRGSFFKTPAQGAGAIPAYVGGDFNVTGNGYKAGGTFAGER